MADLGPPPTDRPPLSQAIANEIICQLCHFGERGKEGRKGERERGGEQKKEERPVQGRSRTVSVNKGRNNLFALRHFCNIYVDF